MAAGRLALLALLGWLAPVGAAGELTAWVTARRSEAEAAAIGPVAGRAPALAALRRAGPPPTAESLDLRWLRQAAASGEPAALALAWERLKAWEQTLQPPPDTLPPERVRRELAAILRDEAYQPLRPADWLERWLPAIERVVDWLFAPFARRALDNDPTPGAAALVYGLLCLALALGLARLLRRRGAPRPVAGLPATAATVEPTAGQWRTESRRAAAAGDLTEALATGYLALLSRLDETGRLPRAAYRTPRETATAATGELGEALGALSDRLEAVIYGGRAATAEDLARLEACLDRWWPER